MPTVTTNLRGHCAGFASRLVAYVIDAFIIGITFSLTTWSLSMLVFTLQLFIFVDIRQYVDVAAIADSPWMIGFAGFLGGFFIFFYNVLFWVTAERTPGKAFMGLRVVTTEGKRLRTHRAIMRNIGYTLSALLFFGGFLWVLLDDRRQGLHDKIAGTYVVYDWEARPDEVFLVQQIEDIRARHLEHERRLGQ